MIRIFFLFWMAVINVSYGNENIFLDKVQPILTSRCIACHSCYNAPCQLNLQSYEGFDRGASNKNVYDGLRLKSVEPSRMFVDAKTTHEWLSKGFHRVNNSKVSSDNIFLELLRIRKEKPEYKVLSSIDSALTCPERLEQTKILGIKNPELGMPFGFPPVNDEEFNTLENWIEKGAPGPSKKFVIDERLETQVKQWENFFNRATLKHKLVSRYLYEHLFLAHIYFPENKKQFFRVIRSENRCGKEQNEISTRRPNDSPGKENFFYCMQAIHYPLVYKTHMPFEFSESKLNYFEALFFKDSTWDLENLPDYSPEVAQNPFITFAAIPAKIRYQFLLKDAQFHVMTFIKGPVCNGTNAVNSIQEQFYTFFISPDSDPMSDSEHQKSAQHLLTLPGAYGSDVDVTDIPKISSKITELREEYRKLRLSWLRKNKPKGLGISDLWDGDKANDNAILTIFRHNDNAVVMKGAVGNLSKTIFVLDYSLFERLVYNLVVNFDVFGNVGHQLLTRVYMDFIRMEAEENFLLLIPPDARQRYRQSWYQGVFTEARMKYMFPEITKGEPTSVTYSEKGHQKTQVVNQILASFNDNVRGEGDSLNWRNIKPEGMKMSELNQDEKFLKKISSIKSMGKLPFARYFPETAYLIIRKNEKIKEVYSIIHNREFQNISWILAESFRRAPHEDTLTLKKGFWIPYPEVVFQVDEENIKTFVEDIRNISNVFEYPKFQKKYQVLASDKNFWSVWDDLNNHMKTHSEVEFGYLDLTRFIK